MCKWSESRQYRVLLQPEYSFLRDLDPGMREVFVQMFIRNVRDMYQDSRHFEPRLQRYVVKMKEEKAPDVPPPQASAVAASHQVCNKLSHKPYYEHKIVQTNITSITFFRYVSLSFLVETVKTTGRCTPVRP